VCGRAGRVANRPEAEPTARFGGANGSPPSDAPSPFLRNGRVSDGPVQILFGSTLEVREGENRRLPRHETCTAFGTLLKRRPLARQGAVGSVRWAAHQHRRGQSESIARTGLSLMRRRAAGIFPTPTVDETCASAPGWCARTTARSSSGQEKCSTVFPILILRHRRTSSGQPLGRLAQMLQPVRALMVDPQVLHIDELSLGLARDPWSPPSCSVVKPLPIHPPGTTIVVGRTR